MSKIDILVNLASRFESKATSDEKYISLVNHLMDLIKGCVSSITGVLELPRYQNSKGLKRLFDYCQELFLLAQKMISTTPSAGVEDLDKVMSMIQFITLPGNAGSGYDGAVEVSYGGYPAPAWYIKNIQLTVENLKSYKNQTTDI